MANSIDNSMDAYLSKMEDDLSALSDMIESATAAIEASPREADKLLIDIVRTYTVRLRVERSALLAKIEALRVEVEFYSGDLG